MSDNRVLRGIFGPGMKLLEDEEKYSGEIHNLYSSPNIIRIINWRRMRWVWSMKYGWWNLKLIAASRGGNQC
jgi:hypothetical protein